MYQETLTTVKPLASPLNEISLVIFGHSKYLGALTAAWREQSSWHTLTIMIISHALLRAHIDSSLVLKEGWE